MKNIKIKLLNLLILILLSSCSTRKLDKQILKSSASGQLEIRMQDLVKDKLEAKRNILLTDTANEQYSVIIFPADTFSFSAQHGFKGKAERIELAGQLRRVINRTDNTVLLAEKQRVMNYVKQDESQKSEISNSRVFKKEGWNLLSLLIVPLVLIAIGWFLWRHVR